MERETYKEAHIEEMTRVSIKNKRPPQFEKRWREVCELVKSSKKDLSKIILVERKNEYD